jgi:alkaline phosphatase D
MDAVIIRAVLSTRHIRETPMRNPFNRRTFLKYSLATSVTVWAGNEIPKHLQDNVKSLFVVDPVSAAASIFPQSLASGDPQVQGITLWTRVTSPRTETVQVSFEIALNNSFTNPILQGVANTDSLRDYTIKVVIDSPLLSPYTTYYYRFIYNNTASATGRFKTLPDPSANLEKISFGYISCQDYTNGFYTALRYLADEAIDFVVHLGDYIYESVGDTSFQRNQVRPLQLPSGQSTAQDLQDYRFLYQTYNSDPDLQRLRERYAFITIWDDHEFSNDSYQSFTTETDNEQQNSNPQLRQAANQAWAEHTATSVPFDANQDPLSSIQIYRSFMFGNLLELVMIDERLYRDAPPCGVDARYVNPACPEQFDANRSMLGNTQRQWFLDKVLNSSRVWKIWGNEVMTMEFKLESQLASAILREPTPDLFFSLDAWDGFAAERTQILGAIAKAGVKSFVTITGDIHTFVAGYQKIDFDQPRSSAVGVEFVVGSVSSSNFAETPV